MQLIGNYWDGYNAWRNFSWKTVLLTLLNGIFSYFWGTWELRWYQSMVLSWIKGTLLAKVGPEEVMHDTRFLSLVLNPCVTAFSGSVLDSTHFGRFTMAVSQNSWLLCLAPHLLYVLYAFSPPLNGKGAWFNEKESCAKNVPNLGAIIVLK